VIFNQNKLVDFRRGGYYLQVVMQKSAHKNISWWWLVKKHMRAVAFLWARWRK